MANGLYRRTPKGSRTPRDELRRAKPAYARRAYRRTPKGSRTPRDELRRAKPAYARRAYRRTPTRDAQALSSRFDMLSAVLATVAAHGLFRPGDRVLVAVSGGPDSMALLHALWELRDRLDLTLEVAAVDHGLRAGAREEIDLVRERARALNLPFAAVAVDVGAERRARRGSSLQDAARAVRLRALAELAQAHAANRVALGHQADDQAETVLYRIVRGTGVAGLAGIPYRRDPFVRPLLDVTRAQILRYLRRRSIPFVEDPSNADARFARARIRHEILPALARENPRVAEALRALAAAARGRGRGIDAADPAQVSSLSRRAAATVARLAARGGT